MSGRSGARFDEDGLAPPLLLGGCVVVIRLRWQIERGLRHPVVGPLLVLLLALLIAFTILHQTSERVVGHVDLITFAIALVLLAALSALHRCSPIAARVVTASPPMRGPPQRSGLYSAGTLRSIDFSPLRL